MCVRHEAICCQVVRAASSHNQLHILCGRNAAHYFPSLPELVCLLSLAACVDVSYCCHIVALCPLASKHSSKCRPHSRTSNRGPKEACNQANIPLPHPLPHHLLFTNNVQNLLHCQSFQQNYGYKLG